MSKDRLFIVGWLVPIAAAVVVGGVFFYRYGLLLSHRTGANAEAVEPQTKADRSGGDIVDLYSQAESVVGQDVSGGQTSANLASSADHVRLSAARDGGDVRIQLDIQDHWHINANPASFDFLIPTEVDIKADGTRLPTQLDYPAGDLISVGFDDPIQVYSGRVFFTASLLESTDDTSTMNVEARIQACNDSGLCLPPSTLSSPATPPGHSP